MKKWLTIVLFLFSVQSLCAQVLERRYIEHQNRNRTYLIYIPSTYDHNSGDKVPLIFAFHGINATDENLTGVGLNAFAERHNFIVIYPQARPSEFGLIAWNCGTVLATGIDDSGFWLAMLDLTMEQYNIDEKRVYTTGFSMGGMMANRLACEYSDRIAAVASVSGPLTNEIYGNCEPVRRVPYMHFHGLADQTVAYFGNGIIGVKGALATVQWWAVRNGCDINYMVEAVPDTADDYYHVDRLVFPDCYEDYEVIHHRIENWPHAWPGPSRNVYATAEIVDFFMRHELQEEDIVLTPVLDNELQALLPRPNPFSTHLDLSHLNTEVLRGSDVRWQIYNSSGQQVISGNQLTRVDTGNWPKGFYFFRLESNDRHASFKLVRE
jgi:polyhydroxybutyrate depolymerase